MLFLGRLKQLCRGSFARGPVPGVDPEIRAIEPKRYRLRAQALKHATPQPARGRRNKMPQGHGRNPIPNQLSWRRSSDLPISGMTAHAAHQITSDERYDRKSSIDKVLPPGSIGPERL